MNLFLSTLKDDIDIRLNLLLEELLHLSYIVRFLKANVDRENADGFYSCEPGDIFPKLYGYTECVKDELTKIVDDWQNLKERLQEFLNSRKNLKERGNLFNKLVDVQNRISGDEQLLSKFDFLQKKLLSYQSGSQHYYPHPKMTSIKEAVKIHLYMENLAREFLELLGSSDNVLFFWDYFPDVRFLTKEDKALIINTDFFLPNRQSHWIILFHEVIHYLVLQSMRKREKGQNLSYFFQVFTEYIEDTSNDCRIALYRYGIDYIPDINTIVDVFIDSLLTKVFGVAYLLPVATRLFAYDEENFLYPQKRRWFLRLSILSKIFSPRAKKEKAFIEDLKELLDYYNKTQIVESAGVIGEEFFTTEAVFESVVLTRVKSFLRKICFPFELLRSLDASPWIKTYIKYTQLYTDRYLNNSWEKKEGRAICFTYQELCCRRNKRLRENEVKEAISNGFQKEVFKFNLLKFRFDFPERITIFDILEEGQFKFLWGLSNFNILTIEEEDINEKVSAIEDLENVRKKLKLMFGDNTEEVRRNESLELYLMKKGFYFYKEELSLTLISENKEDLLNIIQNPQQYVLIFVKFLSKNNDNNNCWEKFHSLFSREGIKTFILSSFDWFSYCTLIAIPAERENGLIDLDHVLKELKGNILLDNNSLLRTETSIFVGRNISDKIKLPYVNILLRISSRDLGKSRKFIDSIKQKGFKVSSSFGIRDVIVHLKEDCMKNLLKNIKEILIIAGENDIKISDIQIEPFIYWNFFIHWG